MVVRVHYIRELCSQCFHSNPHAWYTRRYTVSNDGIPCGWQHSKEGYLANSSTVMFTDFVAILPTQSLPDAELKHALAGFRDDPTLARLTVVWKKGNGSSRERLLFIRSCARLGRAEVVLELLQHILRTEVLCEDLFLDAVHGDKPTVSFTQLESGLARCFILRESSIMYPTPGNLLARGL